MVVQIDAGQVDPPQQRLHAQEPLYRRNGQQLRDVPVRLLIDDGGADPDVRPRPRRVDAASGEFQCACDHPFSVADSLGEQQPVEARRLPDQVYQVRTPSIRRGVIEHVSERCAEHALAPAVLSEKLLVRVIPGQRLPPVRGARAASRRAGSPIHGLAAVVPRIAGFGIAVVAARADLLAAFARIEGVVGPLDLAELTHCILPFV